VQNQDTCLVDDEWMKYCGEVAQITDVYVQQYLVSCPFLVVKSITISNETIQLGQPQPEHLQQFGKRGCHLQNLAKQTKFLLQQFGKRGCYFS
jgi:hypothetical protein